jgi:phage baseplate assembly protein W
MAELKVKKTKFVDFDLNFSLHPISSDIGKRVDGSAVATAIKNLVLTNSYERPFHPELSSQVTELLFENITPSTVINLQRIIRYVIENFEPRAEIINIHVGQEPDNNHLYVEISFKVVGTIDIVTTKFYLERTI